MKGYTHFKTLKEARGRLRSDGFTLSRAFLTEANMLHIGEIEVWEGQNNIFALIRRIPCLGVFVRLGHN